MAKILCLCVFLVITLHNAHLAVGLTSDQQACLNVQNSARVAVGEANMTWSGTAATQAQSWADYLATNCSTIYANASVIGYYGTNIAAGIPPLSLKDAAASFVSQSTFYTLAPVPGGCAAGHECGDYTQVVWNQTSLVGCASAICANTGGQANVVVCYYRYAGNVIGLYPYSTPAPPVAPPPTNPCVCQPAAQQPPSLPIKSSPPPYPSPPKPSPPPPAVIAPAASPPPPFALQDMANVLALHNSARALVKSPDLVWNYTSATNAQAQAVANVAAGCTSSLSTIPQIGQNVEAGYYSSMTATAQNWLNQKSKYTYALFDPNVDPASGCSTGVWSDCGLYTQMVWNTTATVGCGFASCGGGYSVTVCFYYKRGNISKKYPYPPP
eukprot:TRINITY_DN32531_c0_g1_i1.p1 TRINITY_DN32531_c0_g1~~TRINITY_DN32531_c0_g1_i1.p1  ORF type:complete len:383 (+),score=33.94 TRINITY_DN32531_c0_g1_i1:270-1418(+)